MCLPRQGSCFECEAGKVVDPAAEYGDDRECVAAEPFYSYTSKVCRGTVHNPRQPPQTTLQLAKTLGEISTKMAGLFPTTTGDYDHCH